MMMKNQKRGKNQFWLEYQNSEIDFRVGSIFEEGGLWVGHVEIVEISLVKTQFGKHNTEIRRIKNQFGYANCAKLIGFVYCQIDIYTCQIEF